MKNKIINFAEAAEYDKAVTALALAIINTKDDDEDNEAPTIEDLPKVKEFLKKKGLFTWKNFEKARKRISNS